MWGSIHIRRIVRVSQMINRWRRKSSSSSSSSSSLSFSSANRKLKIGCVPSDVPAGHVAVIVGESARRFVVRAKYLNHPLFRNLLKKAEDEFGFDNNNGPICIPCDEAYFEEILRVVTRSDTIPSRCRSSESFPLLRSEKPLC